MADKGAATILLIDDNEIDLEVNKKLLQKGTGTNEVIAKTSARDALAYLNQAQNEGMNKFVILLDIYMPDMNGFDFLQHFQQCPEAMVRHSHVLMLSSSRDELDLNRAQSHPLISDVLKKPLDVSKVSHYLS